MGGDPAAAWLRMRAAVEARRRQRRSPEIRETGQLPAAVPAVAAREDGGRVVVYVLAALSRPERDAAVRVALRALRGQLPRTVHRPAAARACARWPEYAPHDTA
jgi:hypothetical protein